MIREPIVAPARDVVPAPVPHGRWSARRNTLVVALVAAARALAAAGSGLVFVAGVAVVLWALTPDAGADAFGAVRAGAAIFAAGHLLPVTVGGVPVTASPLLLTALFVALLLTAARRGRSAHSGLVDDAVAAITIALVSTVAVAAVAAFLAPPGAADPSDAWRTFLLALLAAGAATFVPGRSTRRWWRSAAPRWVRVGARGGIASVVAVIGGGALAVTAGLATSFGSAVAIAGLTAPGAGEATGLGLLGLLYLPNAVIAAAGYVTGVGFTIGAGSYAPFGSAVTDLPAIPLLAAAPESPGPSPAGLALLAIPFAIAVLVGRMAGRLDGRRDQLAAVGLAAASAGAALALLAVVAGGGVGAGRWSAAGAPAGLLGVAVALEIGLIGAVVAWLTGTPAGATRAADDEIGDDAVAVAGAAEESTEPDEPAHPEVPVEPEEPVEPVEPDEPKEPDEPERPADSEEQSESEGGAPPKGD